MIDQRDAKSCKGGNARAKINEFGGGRFES